MPKQALGPHRQHFFAVHPSVAGKLFSHVRLKTFPGMSPLLIQLMTDGGLKRLRIYGHPATSPLSINTIPALPLTVEAFKSFGSVIQGFSLDTSAPKGVEVSIANQGTAFKFHRLAKVQAGDQVEVERQEPVYDVTNGLTVSVDTLVK